jgi:cytochrome c peroxidase
MARGGTALEWAAIGCALAIFALGCEDDIDVRAQIQGRLVELANPGPPPVDSSNALIGNADAIALGHKFYFDTDFSGYATQENILAETLPEPIRAARGERIRVSCETCHDLDIGGVDPGDPLGNRVSFGGGAYDVNSQPTVNSAYTKMVYWNGRNDSLWSQITSVVESRVSMFGSRNRVAWRIANDYRDQYNALFPNDPIPDVMDDITAQAARINPDGTCVMEGETCPEDYCHLWTAEDGVERCQPRFPLEGGPGFKIPGQLWKCHFGTSDPLQPFGDSYDCMDLNDRATVDRIYANFAKAIAAYEYTLIQVDSPFDRWVDSDFDTSLLSASAQRGAALFVGKAGCSECHSGPMLTDNEFHNIGIPQVGEHIPTVADCPEGNELCDCVSSDTNEPQFCYPKGARDGIRQLIENKFRRDGFFSDDDECANKKVLHYDPIYVSNNPDECDGVVKYYPIPVDEELTGSWKTPTLRNVALTGPYMHNGMFETLEEVVQHYNTAAKDFEGQWIGELSKDIVELNLTDQEVADLVAFLETLTGDPLPEETRSVPTIPPDSPFPAVSPF